MWIGLPACIEQFDNFVAEFKKANADERKAIITKAEEEEKSLTDEIEKARATVYIKTLHKVLEKGNDFIDTELKRVEKLSEGKVSPKKKQQLKDRLQILTSFQNRFRDEL